MGSKGAVPRTLETTLSGFQLPDPPSSNAEPPAALLLVACMTPSAHGSTCSPQAPAAHSPAPPHPSYPLPAVPLVVVPFLVLFCLLCLADSCSFFKTQHPYPLLCTRLQAATFNFRSLQPHLSCYSLCSGSPPPACPPLSSVVTVSTSGYTVLSLELRNLYPNGSS